LRKIHSCAFVPINFWKFSEKIKKRVPRTPFSLPILFLRFADRWNTQERDIRDKSEFSLLFGEKLGSKEVWVGWIEFHIMFWGPEKK